MANYENLRRIAWARQLQVALQKGLVFSNVVNQNYRGDLVPGGTVHIPQIGEVDTGTYTAGSDMSYQTIDDASLTMVIDQKDYFAFTVDQTDAVFVGYDIIGAGVQRGTYRIRDTIDQYIAGKYTEAGVSYGSAASPKATSSGTVFQHLAEFAETMDEANIPSTGRWAIVPPWIMTKLTISAATLGNPNRDVWGNRWIDGVAGFDRIYVSNNVTQIGGTAHTILGSSGMEAISYAGAIDGDIRVLPHPTQRATNVDAVWVYGCKVVRPDMLAVMYSTETAN